MINKKKVGIAALIAAVLAIVVAVVIGGSASAAVRALITGSDVRNESLTGKDIKDESLSLKELSPRVRNDILNNKGEQGEPGVDGTDGVDGKDGKDGVNGTDGTDGLDGAIYRVTVYKNGGGGSATVACADDNAVSQNYTAIAGGVQGSTVAHQAADAFAVTSSFPGRMDWNTGTPKADRLDGWIVLGNGQWTDTLRVWALCVPNDSIPVQVVEIDN